MLLHDDVKALLNEQKYDILREMNVNSLKYSLELKHVKEIAVKADLCTLILQRMKKSVL